MPSLIERIQEQAGGNVALSGLDDLVGQVTQAVELFAKLPEKPEEAVAELLEGLGEVPVPGVQIAAQVGGQIAQVAQAMPTDFSSLTSAFDGILENLEGTLGGDVIPVLRRFVDTLKAAEALTRFDLNATASAENTSGGSGSGSPGGGSGSGSPPPGGDGGGGEGPPGGGEGGGSGSGTPSPEAEAATEAARQRRLQAIAGSRQALSNLPSPLDAPGLVVFLERLLSGVPRENAKVRKLPFFDDAQQLLQTVVDIRHKSDADLRAHIGESLQRLAAFLTQSFAGYLQAYGADLQALAAQSQLPAAQADIGALKPAVSAVAQALEGGSLAGTGPQIAAASAALDGLIPRLEAMRAPHLRSQWKELTKRSRQLPLDLERQMRQLIGMVQPANTFRFLAQLQEPIERALSQFPPERIAEDLRPVLETPLKVFDYIESSGVQEVLQVPAQALEAMLEQIDAVLGQVAAQTSALFSEVDAILAQADPQVLLDGLRQAFENLRLEIESKAQELFQPVAQAIQDALEELHGAVESFDPSAIIDGLKQFLEDLGGIFEDEDVKKALDDLQNGIRQATQAVQSLSFAPATDRVEEQIQGITRALRAVDPATLSTEAKLALTGAKALLPGNLDPVTEPLVQGFTELVDAGPKPLMQFLAQKAAVVKQEVEKFSPAKLVGDSLSAPFQSFLGQLEGFQPLSLLAPLNQALEKFRHDLLDRLDPSAAMQPLQQAYDALLEQVDRINPVQLVRPLEDGIRQATHAFREALPLDEIIGVLDAILDKMQHGLDMAGEVRQTLEQARDLLNALEDAENQLRTWVQPLLNRIQAFGDVSDLAPAVADIGAAVQGCRAAALAAQAAAACDPFRLQLEALSPAASLEELIALRRRLRPDRIATLPDSPEKTALNQLLARFEPLAPLFSDPFQAMAGARAALADSGAELGQTLLRWDARHHRPGGPLARLVFPDFSAADLRDNLSQTLESEFVVPVGRLFETIHQAAGAVRVPLDELVLFLQNFQDRAEALLTGGDSALGGLRNGLQGLVDRIEGVDLEFLTRELQEVFDAVKGKFTVLDPSHLGREIRTSLETALGLLDTDRLLPDQAKQDLNAAYAGVVELLKGLDPKTVVQKAVEPVWDEKVRPAMLKLDMTPLLEAMLAKLDDLKGDLRSELGDVNDKYKEMLDAIPSMGAGEAIGALAGEIGGSIGF